MMPKLGCIPSEEIRNYGIDSSKVGQKLNEKNVLHPHPSPGRENLASTMTVQHPLIRLNELLGIQRQVSTITVCRYLVS